MEERTMRFYPVEVQVGSGAFYVSPGQSLTIPFRVTNRTGRDDFFEISARGVPSTWILLDMPVIHLAPGEQREASVVIQPPAGLGSASGVTSVTIRVASQADPAQAGEAVFDLHVGAYAPGYVPGEAEATVASATVPNVPQDVQFTSDLSPRRVDAGQTARLRIHNLGTTPATFSIQWQSANDALEFVPDQSGPVYVEPGATVAVDFAVSPRSPNWLGAPITLPYTVVVRSNDGEAQAHNGEVISRALIPVWVLPALLVACLTAICGIGFLWNWNQNRLASATATADALIGLVEAATETAVFNQTAAAQAGQEDTDGDGLTNQQEASLGTNPEAADTDNDRLLDRAEVELGTSPLNPDSDGDGTLDGLDIDPLDPNNPSLTATAEAAQPEVTDTPAPTATLTLTLALPSPTVTDTIAPTFTNTPPAPTSTPTVTATITPTQTQLPLPVTGDAFILFESNRDGDSELYLFRGADGSVTRLTNSPGTDTMPAWSPDGSRIVFTSARDGNNEIYVMNADGSGLVNLTQNEADDRFPVWSPDGAFIAFTTNRDGNNEIYVMGADGSNPTNLTQNAANDYAPDWYEGGGLLGGGEAILFTTDRDGNEEIYRMNTDGSDPTNLTENEAADMYPAILPSGGSIAFVSNRDGNLDIFRMDEDGDDPENLSNHPANDTQPDWSPDGGQIIFVSDREGAAELFVMNENGEEVANLSRSPAEELYPAWR